MIIQLANCQLEIGLVYKRFPIEAIEFGPLKGLGGFCEVRVWPKMGWIE